MNLTNYLNQLRSRSDEEKRQIAFGYAVGLTAVIFIIWLISLAISLGNLGQTTVTPVTPVLITDVVVSTAPVGPSWWERSVTGTLDFVDSVGRGANIAVNKLKTNFK